jgi:pimeloyl-ACP methyl ester carboxylesterase
VWSTTRFSAEGRFLGPATDDSLFPVVLAGTLPPAYDRISVPALLVYAVPDSTRDVFAAYHEMGTADRQRADSAFDPFLAYIIAQIAEARRTMRRATVLIVPRANHYVFVSNRDVVERAMQAFLAAN